MPVRIVDIEWSVPLTAIVLREDEDAVLALIRWKGRPIGLAQINATLRILSEMELADAIRAQVRVPNIEARAPATRSSPASVVVCTRERPDTLRSCLEALIPLRALGHEVIIVDNAPMSSSTAALVANYPYRYLCEPTPGLNHARNAGFRAARHDIVAFTDDDCVPDSGWLDALADPYATPAVGGTTGLVLPFELTTTAQERFESYCANRRVFERRLFQAPPTPPSAAGVVGMGANMSFRRALLHHLNGFDVRFDCGTPTLSGGDTELFARMLASGASIVYCPDALVWHRHRRDIKEVRRVVFGYGVGLYAFLCKRLIEEGDREALITALRWGAGPLLKALLNRLRGHPAPTLDLLVMELLGAIHGILRYRKLGDLPA